jgi:hypothetical protein
METIYLKVYRNYRGLISFTQARDAEKVTGFFVSIAVGELCRTAFNQA